MTGNGDVSVQVTNLGNGLPESNLTATLSIRSSDGSVRYVDLPNGSGQATIGAGEEASLVVVNTPDTLYITTEYSGNFMMTFESIAAPNMPNYAIEFIGNEGRLHITRKTLLAKLRKYEL